MDMVDGDDLLRPRLVLVAAAMTLYLLGILTGLSVGVWVRYDQVRRLNEEVWWARKRVDQIDEAFDHEIGLKDRWRAMAHRLWAKATS
jgi:hypothetical protein